MDDDDDFFDDGKVGPSSLLKNIVTSSEIESKSRNRETITPSPYNSPSGFYENGSNPRFEASNVPRNYDDIPQASSGSSNSPEVISPVARKPPLPPSDTHRLAQSLNISPSYGGSREDRCKNPELRLDLSNLTLSKSKKKRKKVTEKSSNGITHHQEEDDGVNGGDFNSEKTKTRKGGKGKVKVPTGTPKKKPSDHKKVGLDGHFYNGEDGDSCSTCQSSSSSTVSEVGAEDVSEHSDVTSVSPLSTPHSNHPQKLHLSLPANASSAAPRNTPTSPAADDLFRLMRRLIDDVDKDHRIARGRGQQTWAFADRAATANAWRSSVSTDAKSRHPTLGEIIQSLSRYQGTRSGKSNSSAAPSVASGAGSGYTATTSTFSHTSSHHTSSNLEPPRRKYHAAINRDKKQREIAAENLRMFQRLQGVRASPELSRERQINDWQRQVSYGVGASTTIDRPGYSRMAEHSFGIAPLAGLIASAGHGTKPLRPQSAVAYLTTPPSQASSVTSEQPRRHRHLESGSRPSSGSIHSRTVSGHGAGAGGSQSGSVLGEIYLEGAEYRPEATRKKKKKSRPISGHF